MGALSSHLGCPARSLSPRLTLLASRATGCWTCCRPDGRIIRSPGTVSWPFDVPVLTRNKSRGAISCDNGTTTSLLHEDGVDILRWLSLVRAACELRCKIVYRLLAVWTQLFPRPGRWTPRSCRVLKLRCRVTASKPFEERSECVSCKVKSRLSLKRCKHFELGGDLKTKGAALVFY